VGNGDDQGADRRRLIHHQQHRTIRAQPVDQATQLGLIIGQRTVQQPFADPVERDRMMGTLAHIDTEKHTDFSVRPVVHPSPITDSTSGQAVAASLDTHVTAASTPNRSVQPLSAITHCRPAPATTQA
jgi:hypothetical protein